MPHDLRGLRILVVEDNFLIAESTRALLDECGCEIVGPISRLGPALKIAAEAALDGALLDINLAGEYCFPLAVVLRQRGIPFVFVSGYDDDKLIPKEFGKVPRLGKPFDGQEVAEAAARHFAAR